MTHRLHHALLACVLATTPAAADEMTLSRQTLIATDHTLVVQIDIAAPRSDATEMTRLDFRWHGEISRTVSNGMWDQTDTIRRATLVVVAQLSQATREHPAVLMLSTQQQSRGAAHTFQAHRLDAARALSDVLTLDVEPGAYDVAEPLRIGTLGGEPIVFSLAPFPEEEAP